jgi:hypothetical protein
MASPVAGQLKRYLLLMVAAVVMLDGAAIGLYYALHVKRASVVMQQAFAGAWIVLTLAVVMTGLSRIRNARLENRRRRQQLEPDQRPSSAR